MCRYNDQPGKSSFVTNASGCDASAFLSSKQFTINQANSRQNHVDDHLWIEEDDRNVLNGRSQGRRSAQLNTQYPELQMSRPVMYNQEDQIARPGQQKPSRSWVLSLIDWQQCESSFLDLDDRQVAQRQRIITIECYRSVADYAVLVVKKN